MKSLTRQLLMFGPILLALSACGSSDKSDDDFVDAGDFVKEQFAATSDRTDPIEINSINFRFNEQEDSDAFDSLLN